MNWNRVLDDSARGQYADTIGEIRRLTPEMSARKIPRADVQQAFVFDAVQKLTTKEHRVLGVGVRDDTAWAALLETGWRIDAIDSSWGKTLEELHADLGGRSSYDLAFSTSVLEHVADDEGFVKKLGELVHPGGVVVMTVDFDRTWDPEIDRPFDGCHRMYTVSDMHRIARELENFELLGAPTWEDGDQDFQLAGRSYAFATLVARKKKK